MSSQEPNVRYPKLTEALELPNGVERIVGGRYELVDKLGEGGFAVVYKARHTELRDLFYAIKILRGEHAGQAEVIKKFRHEAVLLSGLKCPQTVRVMDFGVTGGAPYFVMEFVTGVPLESLLTRHGKLPPAMVARLSMDILESLDEAHKARIVHRDIKPANVLVVEGFASGPARAKVLDFGIAKVVGGRFNVLATDIYKQVIGQQNFEMGAVVGVILLLPALLSFAVDRAVARRQVAQLSARAVPFEPKPHGSRDLALMVFCLVIGLTILGVFAVSVWASFITFWPYNLTLTLKNYAFGNFDPLGWGVYWNSLVMASMTAVFGTAIVFTGAYLVEKSKGFHFGRGAVHLLAMIPLAVPGLVLGLSYIFFFNMRGNPLGVLYGTMALLVINTIAHFYTVSHLTALTALKQLDAEFEAVSASLKVPVWRTFFRITVPICLPAILDVAIYLFVNAMTTVSAVIFLYSSETKPAALAIVNMDESGFTAGAAGMATVIVATSAAVKLAQLGLSRLLSRTQAWRKR